MNPIAVFTLAALSLLAAEQRTPAPAVEPLENAARATVSAIDSEAKTDALFELFNDEMRKAVPLPKLRGTLQDVRTGLGKVASRTQTSRPTPGSAVYALEMERGRLEMSLAVDERGRIIGLFLRPPGAAPPAGKVEEVGANLEAALRSSDAKAFARDFADSTRAALPESKIRELLNGIGAQLGKLQERSAGSRPSPDTTIWPLRFERGSVDLKVVLDGQGKIIGIWFLPPGAAGGSEKPPERNSIDLRLPFHGRWEVFWGGDTAEQNAHHAVANQRHAMDWVGVHGDGSRYRGDGTRNEDWAAYGREILAPASGLVTDVIEGVRDNRPGSMNPYSALGNTVIVRLAEDQYAVLAHLKPGTIRVRPGGRVARGEVMGLCGNSGNSSEPHLHFHLQQTPILQDGLGIRCHFETVVVDRSGRRETRSDYSPVRGDVVVAEP